MTAIIVIAGIVGLVWGAVLILRGSLVGGGVVYLIAASVFGVNFYSFDAAGLTWSIDRFVLMALVGAYLIQTKLGRTEHKPIGWTDVLLGAFIGLVVLSTFTHDWHTHTADEVPIIMHLVNGYLVPLVLYWLAREATLREKNVNAVQILLAVFGIYLAVTAILEVSGQLSLVYPRYIANPKLGIHFGRARGPMLQSAQFGAYLVTCLTATWIVWVWQKKLGRRGQLFALLLVPLYLAAIYFTYTRSVWMGTALAAAIVLGLTLKGVWRPLFLGGMCAALLAVVLLKGDDLVAFKREYSAEETRESTYMRASFAYVSWKMFQDKPLAGFGFGQFPRESGYYLSDRTTNLHLESIRGYIHHNTLLSVLVELGIFGLILYVTILCHFGYSAWKLWQDRAAPTWVRGHGLFVLAAFAPYLFQVVFRDVSVSPIENSLIFLLGGIACGLRVMLTRRDAIDAPAYSAFQTPALTPAGQ